MTPIAGKTWNQRLFTLLWSWLAFRTILPWLVFFRLTFEGDSYSWGSEYFGRMFHSTGLARPDFLLVYAMLAVSLYVLWQLRRHRFTVGGPLMLAYLGIFAANALYQWLAGEPMIFRGDTLDVTVNLTIPFFILNFGMFAVAVAWWWGARNAAPGGGPRALTPARRNVVRACVAFVPVQLALLMLGEPHALTDEIGVIGTMLQWVMLAWALYPGSDYRVDPAPRSLQSRTSTPNSASA